jgi:DNA-binding NarL/FixJ family response regulator
MHLMIVDDHEVVREGLLASLASVEGLRVLGAVSTGRAALKLARRVTPDVALVDFRLPDMGGDELCRQLLALSPSISVVMLSSYLSEEIVRSSLQAGASAYVTKAAGLPKLREALDEIRAAPGRRVPVHRAPQLVKQLDRLVAERQGALRVTPRQERILELAAEGLTNRVIGERLFISESTVRFHIQKLKGRFGARTRSELVARAIRLGVIPPGPEAFATASSQ